MAAVAASKRLGLVFNKSYKPSGIGSYNRAMRKYGFNRTAPPASIAPGGSSSASSGQEPATDTQQDAEYLCPVAIGTPAQTLNLDFDTGSSDLWVWSTQLPSSVTSQSGASHTIFDPSKSSTFQNTSGSTWQISYGDGSTASGTVGTDNIKIADVTVTGQAIELAQNLSSQFASGAGDGLLGLAWPSINTVKPTPVATPVENMITQSDIPSTAELFTAYLSTYKDSNTVSFYTFGGFDQDILTALNASASSIYYTDVDNSNGFWQFSSPSASVNGKTISLSGNTAIADTGTTLALVSDQVCQAIYNAIPGAKMDSQQGGYVFPTSVTQDQLPTVQVSVGGQLFTINKEELSFASAGTDMVFGGVQSRGSMTFDILGDVFLKNIYAVFDQGNKRFGAVQRPA